MKTVWVIAYRVTESGGHGEGSSQHTAIEEIAFWTEAAALEWHARNSTYYNSGGKPLELKFAMGDGRG